MHTGSGKEVPLLVGSSYIRYLLKLMVHIGEALRGSLPASVAVACPRCVGWYGWVGSL